MSTCPSLRVPVLLFSFLFSCENAPTKGFLKVSSLGKGTYEIYKIASETPLQLISEEVGYFNKKTALDPGTYLIFADCSSDTIVIHPNTTRNMIVHTVKFEPSTPVNKDDMFLIQCNRHNITQTRQRLVNDFELNILPGTRDLLVGMMPLSLDLMSKVHFQSPKLFSYALASISVADYESRAESVRFFVSPTKDNLSITESQELGRKMYLMPGVYSIELNGSFNEIALTIAENRVINPAFLKVSISPQVSLNIVNGFRGNPMSVEINGSHWLNLNEVYALMPGASFLRLEGNENIHKINLISDTHTEKIARAVQVNLDCPPWDWHCFGSKKIYLFYGDQNFPFATGLTDVPLLYFDENIYVTMEGSRGIMYELDSKKDFIELQTGTVSLQQKYDFRPGFVTDLVHIEAGGGKLKGQTFDLPLDSSTQLHLIEGRYQLTQYLSSTSIDGDRRKQVVAQLNIKPKEREEQEFVVYINEKKLKNIRESKLAKLSAPINSTVSRSRYGNHLTKRYKAQ